MTQNPNRRHEWDFRIKEAQLINASASRKGAKFRSRGSLLGHFELLMEHITVGPNCMSAVRLFKSMGMPLKTGGGSWHYHNLGSGKGKFVTNIRIITRKTKWDKLLVRYLLEPFLKWMTYKSLKRQKNSRRRLSKNI